MAAATATLGGGVAPQGGGYVFTYFRSDDDGRGGLRLALSRDGRRFGNVRGGEPLFAPKVGEKKLMRDPSIAQDPRSGLFHLVWTTDWFGKTIGHASSPDLVDWSPQQAIPVMEAFPKARNSWAPELIFDPAAEHWVILWSSSVDGAFPDDPGIPGMQVVRTPLQMNNRIYATTTTDFRSFSPTRLLFNPGFSVIDATFLRSGDKLYIFFKDERDNPTRKHIQWCEAASPLGPFGPLSEPITAAWAEGPSAVQMGDDIVVFFDRYLDKRYGAVATRDMVSWRNISAEISMPSGSSHGTIAPIDAAVFNRLAKL
jgi:hypothetical protein